MPIEFLSFHALYQGWHSKRKCNCNSNSICSNKITYFVKTCKLAFSQISDSNKASNKASTRINRVACCHKVSNFRCSSRGSSCPQPPLQPMQFGQTPMQAQQMMFPPQPPMSFGAPQAFPQGQFSPQVTPLLQQNQQQGFMQQPQRPQFQKNIGGVVVFLSVIALLHFVHPACIHLRLPLYVFFLLFQKKSFFLIETILFGLRAFFDVFGFLTSYHILSSSSMFQ